MRRTDLAEDVVYAWRTDRMFRAAWRAYMRRNAISHGTYLRDARGFGEAEAVMPWHPSLRAFRAHQRAREARQAQANRMTVTSSEHRRVPRSRSEPGSA